MKKQNNREVALSNLRRKADGILKSKEGVLQSRLFESDDLKLAHELEALQIEMALQNDELILSRSELKQANEKYIDLYDSAPTGYFTLSTKGDILEVNLSGAAMLGKKRSLLINEGFQQFLTGDSKPIFILFFAKVFKTRVKQSCKVYISR